MQLKNSRELRNSTTNKTVEPLRGGVDGWRSRLRPFELAESDAIWKGAPADSVVMVFTDGSANNKTREGGFAYVLRACPGDIASSFATVSGGAEHDVLFESGISNQTTSNRMELEAAIRGLTAAANTAKRKMPKLEAQDTKVHIRVISDSQYVVRAVVDGWIASWSRGSWTNFEGEDVKNRDLWERLWNLKVDTEASGVKVSFEWVKGHSGDFHNELCDFLAGSKSSTGQVSATFSEVREFAESTVPAIRRRLRAL